MADPNDLSDFNGQVRLFPLPNLVLFPHVVQPLHIFEPRYRQLMADALASDRRITMVLLKPDWNQAIEANPPLFSVACLGEIVAHKELEDGRYNLMLRGVARIQLLAEIETDRMYRTAQAKVLVESSPWSEEVNLQLRNQLAEVALPRFPVGQVRDHLAELVEAGISLAALTDVLTYALPINLTGKQALLEDTNPARRAEILIALLQSLPEAAPPRKYPPEFSLN